MQAAPDCLVLDVWLPGMTGVDLLEHLPDCLVLDVWLPGMTGVDLLEHLVETGSTLPAVIITGRDDLQIRMRAMQARVAAYLRKPLDGQALLQALQEALDRRCLSGGA